MFVSSKKHAIHYRISPQLGSVRLTFWEMAPRKSKQMYPYLYIANYLLKSVEEAHQLLKDHLFVNGVATVDALEFTQQGCINLVPYPTWSRFNVSLESIGLEAVPELEAIVERAS
ncbi:MAG: hypothetical protein AAFV72_02750 [Cyanobacteria bacterium J06635_1]